MMHAEKFYAGANHRIWVYRSTPSLRCPYAEGPPAWLEDTVAASEDPGGLDLRRVFVRAHRNVGDVPTDGGCRGCGATMERLGWYAYAMEPWPSERELERETRRLAKADGVTDPAEVAARVSMELSSRAVNLRVGGGLRRVPRSGRYWPTKREAIAWCREEAALDRSYNAAEARA